MDAHLDGQGFDRQRCLVDFCLLTSVERRSFRGLPCRLLRACCSPQESVVVLNRLV